MNVKIEDKQFDDKSEAVTELAFCHYPVRVEINGTKVTFATFDAARLFVENDGRKSSAN